MAMRDLVTGGTGGAACTAPRPSSSSSNPLSSLADTIVGSSSKAELIKELHGSMVGLKASFDPIMAVPLSTVPGAENEIKQDDERPIASMKGTDFICGVNGHHEDSCGETFQSPIFPVHECRGIEPHLQEFEQIGNSTGPPQMNAPHPFCPFLRSGRSGIPISPFHILAYQSEEYLQNLVRLYRTEEYLQKLINATMDSIDTAYDYQMRIMRWFQDISYAELEKCWNQSGTWNTEFKKQNDNTEALAHSFEQQHGANSWFSEFEQDQHKAQLATGQIGGTSMTNMVAVEQSHRSAQTLAYDNHPKFQGMERRLMNHDELSGDWVSLLWVVFSHLGALSQPMFWHELIKHEEVIGHRVWVKVEGLQQRSGWTVELEATRQSIFDAIQDAAMLAVNTMRLHFPREFRGTPFIVLPMLPGQRSSLDYPVGSVSVTATFMGISINDIRNLRHQHLLSLTRELKTRALALREHALKKQQGLEELGNMSRECACSPKRERKQISAEILKKSGEIEKMGIFPANALPGNFGWSVSVSNEEQQQREPQEMEPLEDGMQQMQSHWEEIRPASSRAVLIRAML